MQPRCYAVFEEQDRDRNLSQDPLERIGTKHAGASLPARSRSTVSGVSGVLPWRTGNDQQRMVWQASYRSRISSLIREKQQAVFSAADMLLDRRQNTREVGGQMQLYK